MKKIILILACLLILTGCTLKKPSTETSTEQKPEEGKEETVKGSLKSLFGMGKNQKCTIEKEEEGKKTKITIYLSGKKFKQDVKFEDPQSENLKEMEIHVLSDGESLYSWNSFNPGKGTKSKMEDWEKEMEEFKTEGKGTDMSQIDLEREYDYQCSPWVSLGNDFDLPSGVEFKEFSLASPQSQGENQGETIDICAFCDKAPTEEAKEQCRTNANCN